MTPTVMTPGTIGAIAIGCIIAILGVLQGVDWVHVIGSQSAGWVAAVISALNTLFHVLTGPTSNQLTMPARRDLGVSGH